MKYKKSVQAKLYSEGVKMTVRETYMKDYLITYLRKALKILNDMLLLKNMPADFPAEKI